MIEVLPATADRFQDVSSIPAPGNPGSAACWCLSYRIPGPEFNALTGDERPARLRRFAEEGTPPGVIPSVDGVPVWSIICFVVRPPFRRRGLAARLLHGAVDYARASGAPQAASTSGGLTRWLMRRYLAAQ